MVGVPRSSAIADWPAGRLALESVKVEVLMEDVTTRVEFCAVASVGQVSLAFSTIAVLMLLLLLLLVVTVAPFKLFTRAEALLRGVHTRFLGGFPSVDGSATLTFAPRPDARLEPVLVLVLMLAGVDAKVDTAAVVAVATDAPCSCESLLLLALLVGLTPVAEAVGGSPRDGVQLVGAVVEVCSGVASLGLLSWRISGLLRRPSCCCSSVVVPTEAGGVFPK